jgi:hypothetical protein
MNAELYRELFSPLGDAKTLEKVILREIVADNLGEALVDAPDWSNMSQFDSVAIQQRHKDDR